MLENETATWTNAESTIRLVKRSDTPNRMLIVYQHTALTPGGPGVPAVAPAPPAAPAGKSGNAPATRTTGPG